MTVSTSALLIGIGVLAIGTYACRFAGPVLAAHWTLPDRLQHMTTTGTVVLLTALVATATFIDGRDIASPARILGVAVGGLLAWRRVPFVLVVLAAATTTALLRLAGLP
jgi:uncharacterized membrane protein